MPEAMAPYLHYATLSEHVAWIGFINGPIEQDMCQEFSTVFSPLGDIYVLVDLEKVKKKGKGINLI